MDEGDAMAEDTRRAQPIVAATVEDDETVDGLTGRLQPPAALEAGEGSATGFHRPGVGTPRSR
jgi:hypothetical protein